MADQDRDGLTPEELQRQRAERLPDREAMSVLGGPMRPPGIEGLEPPVPEPGPEPAA